MKTYRITELGRRFGLSRSTLLYYDRIGLLHPSGRSESDYRLYTDEDCSILERICFYRKAGLRLSEIASLLGNSSNDGSILEKRLREIDNQIFLLRSQQRLVLGLLKTVVAGHDASGLDKELWLSLQKACGLDEAALKHWHIEFERKAPGAHHNFLLSLGLDEKEAVQVRMLTKSVEDNTMRMKYFYEVFEDLPRQGPGCREATIKALGLLRNLPSKPRVLDVGCGSGMQTIILAEELKTKILAIDNHKPMLDNLNKRIASKGVDIETYEMSMFDIAFEKNSFDLLWAEGSIFIIGLARGLKEFKSLIKHKGYFAFTEMCYFVNDPPSEIREYFNNIYPDIKTIDEVRKMAETEGYKIIETFNLPDSAWWDDYYTPMLERIKELEIKNCGVPEAEAVYKECKLETEMFSKYSRSYGYTFFILQKE